MLPNIPKKDDANYNCVITTDTGEQHRVYANWIRENNLDQWQGWHCSAGSTRFYIDANSDVWSGECKNDYLGNVLTNWETKNGTVCQRTTCTPDTDDLATKKYQPE